MPIKRKSTNRHHITKDERYEELYNKLESLPSRFPILRFFNLEKNQKKMERIYTLSTNKFYHYNTLNSKDLEVLGCSFLFSLSSLFAKAIFIHIFKEKNVPKGVKPKLPFGTKIVLYVSSIVAIVSLGAGAYVVGEREYEK